MEVRVHQSGAARTAKRTQTFNKGMFSGSLPNGILSKGPFQHAWRMHGCMHGDHSMGLPPSRPDIYTLPCLLSQLAEQCVSGAFW
eukprot:295400-Chlamydomonas_euryale.AAC.3